MPSQQDKKTSEEYPPPIQNLRGGCGYYTYEVESYEYFIHRIVPHFVRAESPTGCKAKEPQKFVWRGMQEPSWRLLSTLSRFASDTIRPKRGKPDEWFDHAERLTFEHLLTFMQQLRGLKRLESRHDELYVTLEKITRGDPAVSIRSTDLPDNLLRLAHELFSLGQHNYLCTPFLDWTTVPMVALYFAFEQKGDRPDGMGHRVVFALNPAAVKNLNKYGSETQFRALRIVESLAHDNPRIVAQSGLFTFSPAHTPVDEWVVSRCQDNESMASTPVLVRFLIRNTQRAECLAELEACNINARTVYPDLSGAAKHTNYLSEISARRLTERRP